MFSALTPQWGLHRFRYSVFMLQCSGCVQSRDRLPPEAEWCFTRFIGEEVQPWEKELGLGSEVLKDAASCSDSNDAHMFLRQ